MERATVVSDFPILAESVSRQLGVGFQVVIQTWNDFLEEGWGSTDGLLVVDVTTIGERVALELVDTVCSPARVAVASLHTNEVRLYRSDGLTLQDDGLLPTMLALKT